MTPDVLRYARGMCQALYHVHQSGVLHRDVALKNMWLDGEDRVHLGDFDTAVWLDRPLPEGYANILTTDAVLAPEQLRGQRGDARSDIYAFGAALYELATGVHPFAEDGPLGSNGAIAPPHALGGDLPAGFDVIVLKMLAASPDDRFQTAAEVFEALTAIWQPRPRVLELIALEKASAPSSSKRRGSTSSRTSPTRKSKRR